MTSTKLISATVVTPQKVELQNRGMGATTTSNNTTTTMSLGIRSSSSSEQPKGKAAIQEQQPTRVFRCLSNTNANVFSPISPESRTRSPSHQRSALKHMFQPPVSSHSTSRKQPCSPRQQQEERQPEPVVRLDRSTLSRRALRRSKPTRFSSPEEAANEGAPHKKVNFHSVVTAVAIPSHRMYSPTTKKALWGSMKEIKANAIRNTAEFIHDRCNWRKACEEEQMYRDSRNGVLIHPVHVQRYYAALQAHKDKKQKQQQREEEQQQKTQQEEQVPAAEKRIATPPSSSSRISRKRVRCCSPSPIRRARVDASSPDYERHEAKRRRLHVPVPCRPVYYYSEQQHGQAVYGMPQQENCSYQHHYEYPSNSPPPMMYSVPFPHHPRRNSLATETA